MTKSLFLSLTFGLLASLAFASSANAQASLPDNFTVAQPQIPSHTIHFSDLGAVGDGKTLNTDVFKKAVASIDAQDGGKIEIPAGTYLTGPFKLTNNIELHLADGATIKFTDDRSQFKLTDGGYEICLSAENCHDIAITGNGTIDGSGQSWWTEFRAYQDITRGKSTPPPGSKPTPPPHRPYMIWLNTCSRVLLQGVTLTNSPMFHFVPKDCHDVTIDSITILAPATSPNTDGIDPSGSNFHITNCTIDTGDDNIALKPHPAEGGHAGCENFLIEHMTFRHGHGMSIGGGSHGGVRNMLVRDCTFENTDAGVRMKAGRDRGGVVEHLTYENLKMTDVKTPINIISYYPNVPSDLANDPAKPITDHTPIWKDLVIRNLTATGANLGCQIVGLAEQHAQNILLENVNISSNGLPCQIIRADDIKFVNSKVTSTTGAPNQIVDSKVDGL
jgi:polygalacturonase